MKQKSPLFVGLAALLLIAGLMIKSKTGTRSSIERHIQIHMFKTDNEYSVVVDYFPWLQRCNYTDDI